MIHRESHRQRRKLETCSASGIPVLNVPEAINQRSHDIRAPQSTSTVVQQLWALGGQGRSGTSLNGSLDGGRRGSALHLRQDTLPGWPCESGSGSGEGEAVRGASGVGDGCWHRPSFRRPEGHGLDELVHVLLIDRVPTLRRGGSPCQRVLTVSAVASTHDSVSASSFPTSGENMNLLDAHDW
jgi:hypothetical protein